MYVYLWWLKVPQEQTALNERCTWNPWKSLALASSFRMVPNTAQSLCNLIMNCWPTHSPAEADLKDGITSRTSRYSRILLESCDACGHGIVIKEYRGRGGSQVRNDSLVRDIKPVKKQNKNSSSFLEVRNGNYLLYMNFKKLIRNNTHTSREGFNCLIVIL